MQLFAPVVKRNELELCKRITLIVLNWIAESPEQEMGFRSVINQSYF